MCDLVTDSVLDRADVETERGVILEEIAMHDDEPGDEVHDLFARAVYGDHPLGRLISGTEETITADDPPADPELLPAPLHAAADRDRRRRQPRPRRGGQAGPRRRSRGTPLDGDRPTPAPPAAGRPGGTRRAGRHAGRARQGHRAGARGARLPRHRPHRRAALRPRRAQQRRSAAACPAGCSRRSGSSAAWPTRSTPTPAVRRHRPLRRLRGLRAGQGRRGAGADPRRAGPGGRRRASPTRSSPGARACSRARSCWAWRTPARG